MEFQEELIWNNRKYNSNIVETQKTLANKELSLEKKLTCTENFPQPFAFLAKK